MQPHLPCAPSAEPVATSVSVRVRTCDLITESDGRAETRYLELCLQLISVLSPEQSPHFVCRALEAFIRNPGYLSHECVSITAG